MTMDQVTSTRPPSINFDKWLCNDGLGHHFVTASLAAAIYYFIWPADMTRDV